MPVLFEQPQPFAPAVNAGYGAQLRGDQNRQYGLEVDQHRQHWASLALQAQQQQQHQEMEAARFVQHQQEYQQEPQRQQQMLGQQVQARAWLNGQDLNQNEKIRLQRMNQQIDWLHSKGPEEMGGDGTFSWEDIGDHETRLRTGIDMFTERQKAAQTKAQEAAEKQRLQAATHQKAMEEHGLQISRMSIDQRKVPEYNPQTGEFIGYWMAGVNTGGFTEYKLHPVKPAKEPVASTPILGMGTRAGFSPHDIYKMVADEEKEMIAKDKDGNSHLVGPGRDIAEADGGQPKAMTTATTQWHEMPAVDRHAEAERRVRARLERMTGSRAAGQPLVAPVQNAQQQMPGQPGGQQPGQQPGMPPGMDADAALNALRGAAGG